MSVVTIGLDFGTSSIKCVVRGPTGTRHVIHGPSGELRWRAMLGKIREGADCDRLLLFGECDEEEWRIRAIHESNLKLALLARPGSPSANALSERWSCVHYALPTLLLAAALCHALKVTRARFPESLIHVFMGAPVDNPRPDGPIFAFERALHAAYLLAQQWQRELPRKASTAVRDSAAAWEKAEVLPGEEERLTRVVPEAFAACEGAVAAGAGVGLSTGRLCVIDMGGGTTDAAWINANLDGYNPLGLASFDVAGDWIESPLVQEATRLAGRRVRRQEFWLARARASTPDQEVHGVDWTLTEARICGCLGDSIRELAKRFQQRALTLDEGSLQSPKTRLVLVGGATAWAPVRTMLVDALGPFHEGLEILPVGEFGLDVSAGDSPMAVAVGLSNGYWSWTPDRWTEVAQPAPDESSPRAYRECPCRGLATICERCGGSGIQSSGDDGDRFGPSIDLMARHPFAARCSVCKLDFPRESIYHHLREAHPEAYTDPQSIAQPATAPAAAPVGPDVDLLRVRYALASGSMRQLNVAEQLMHQQLEAIWRICIQAPESSATPIRAFLRWSAEAVNSFRWLHLPRAIAFARIGWQEDVVRELKAADSADFTYVSRIECILRSNRPTRFAEAWTCLMT